MALHIGEVAPHFSVADVTGRAVDLADYKKDFVLIAFLRYAGCPWCNMAVHRLAMEHPLLRDSNCQIVAFIQSSEQDIKTNIFDRHNVKPLFPIIADRDMAVYHQYGVQPSIKGVTHHIKHLPAWVQSISKDGLAKQSIDSNFFLAPAVFLLSPRQQQIIRVDYGADLYKHESFTDIYDDIATHNLYGIKTD